jgi:hypothetical protein
MIYSSFIFSSCLCNRPIAYPWRSVSVLADNFSMCMIPIFFTSFTKLETISKELGEGIVLLIEMSFEYLKEVHGRFLAQ